MAAFIARRLLQGAATMLGVAILVFGLLHLSGDPALVMSSPDATPEQIEQLRHALGLDRPLPVQLAIYLERLAQGDLGQSLRFNRPVAGLILERLPNTLELTLAAMLVAVTVALPSGIVAAIHRGERLGRLLMAGALAYEMHTSFSRLYGPAVLFWLSNAKKNCGTALSTTVDELSRKGPQIVTLATR